jgi:hypothetical protein
VPPPLKFESFFPCPRPLTTTTTDSIIPVPDFVQYQNQAIEIDRLSQKINLLTKALRVAGVYDASQEALGRLLEDTETTSLSRARPMRSLASQGGIENSISFFPLKDIIAALSRLRKPRAGQGGDVRDYRDLRHCAGRDSTRTRPRPPSRSRANGAGCVSGTGRRRFNALSATMRLKAEVHAGQFQPTTLKTMSNVPLADQAMKQQLRHGPRPSRWRRRIPRWRSRPWRPIHSYKPWPSP